LLILQDCLRCHKIRCDALSTIDKAFSNASTISVDDSTYDILLATQHFLAQSTLHWKIHHIWQRSILLV
jgi:hypothetical protein